MTRLESGAWPGSLTTGEGKPVIFDTHLHLVDRKRLSYPWLGDAPALNRDWSYDDYEATARRIGITDVLHMEVDVAEADMQAETAFIAELMQRPDSLIRGAIAASRPEAAGFAAWLEAVDRRVVKGVRRALHVVPDEVSQAALFRQNIALLGAAGLPFDIVVNGGVKPCHWGGAKIGQLRFGFRLREVVKRHGARAYHGAGACHGARPARAKFRVA